MAFQNKIEFYFFEDDKAFNVIITGKTKEAVKEVNLSEMINSLGRENELKSGEVVVTSTIEENGEWEDSDEYFSSYKKTA